MGGNVTRIVPCGAHRRLALLALLLGLCPGSAAAQSDVGSIRGAVVDQLGAGVEATVTLVRDGQPVRETRSDSGGGFSFSRVPTGRYRVEAEAHGFSPALSDLLQVDGAADVALTLRLQIGPIEQHVVVTASAAEVVLLGSGPLLVWSSGWRR